MYVFIFIFLPSIPMKAMDHSTGNHLEKEPVLTELEKTFLQAVRQGNASLFSECLAKGVDCNVSGCNVMGVYGHGNTALQTICISGQYLLLPLILNAPGIDVSKSDKFGDTALHYAANYNASQTPGLHAVLFASLIKHGANVNAKNNALETPLAALLKIPRQPTQLSEILIDNGADISLNIPLPNPLDPNTPIVTETIFQRAIRCNNPLHLFAFLKSPKGITKSTVLKALILTRFGFKNYNWGNTLWPKSLAQENLKANFKAMEQTLRRYYFTMQGLGFYVPVKDQDKNKETDWQQNPNSIQIPIDLAKKIAWHAAKDAPFTSFEKKCLSTLFGVTKPYAS